MKAQALATLLLEADPSDKEIERRINQLPNYLTRPYTLQEIKSLTNNGEKYIDVNVPVGLWDLIDNDVEWLNDHVSELVTRSLSGLEDGYSPVEVDGDNVIINVVASVANFIARNDEEE